MAGASVLSRAHGIPASGVHVVCACGALRGLSLVEKAAVRGVPILCFFNCSRIFNFLYRLSAGARPRSAVPAEIVATCSTARLMAFPWYAIDIRPAGIGSLRLFPERTYGTY